jgi:hypothetical protein
MKRTRGRRPKFSGCPAARAAYPGVLLLMVTSFQRGHKIIFKENVWVYNDTLDPISVERPCKRCGRMPTSEGYDACLGYIPGVVSACCGHGKEDPFQ